MRSDKDYREFGKAVFEKCKDYIVDDYGEIDVDDLMELATKNNLCTYELYDVKKHGEGYDLEEDEDYIYWWK